MTSYHRVKEVRERQGMLHRTVSRRTGLKIGELREKERPASDLRLSELFNFAKALDVPAGELLIDSQDSEITRLRGFVVRVARAANAILEAGNNLGEINNFAGSLREQARELLPGVAKLKGTRFCGSTPADTPGKILENVIVLGDYIQEPGLGALLQNS